jgi:hypothetical protein
MSLQKDLDQLNLATTLVMKLRDDRRAAIAAVRKCVLLYPALQPIADDLADQLLTNWSTDALTNRISPPLDGRPPDGSAAGGLAETSPADIGTGGGAALGHPGPATGGT